MKVKGFHENLKDKKEMLLITPGIDTPTTIPPGI